MFTSEGLLDTCRLLVSPTAVVLMKELKSSLSTEHISAINERGVTDLLDTFMGVGG